MNEKLFPSMKNIPSFDKEEKDYLVELLSFKLIELAKLVTDEAIDEENLVNVILNKLREQ